MSILEVKIFTGEQTAQWLEAVANLRIQVFADWPYLYVGTRESEAGHLAHYASSPNSVFVLAFEHGHLVGAATGAPLADEGYSLLQPFRSREIAVDDVFHFGESALRKEYRGYGIGNRFFDERERHARRIGSFRTTAFCAVERASDDPRRPLVQHSNDAFWMRRGYRRQDDMVTEFEWPETAGGPPLRHRMRFWMRALET